jgi:LytS/YehU family sensor histidine kinase
MVFYLSSSVVIGFTNYYLSEYVFGNAILLLYGYRDVYEGLTLGVLSAILVTSIPAWYKLNSDKLKSDSDAKQLINDKIQEELKFLKAQINPHFLFNSLNTVFNLIDSNKEDAKKTLVQFSEILRFQLYEAGNDTISLAKEMEYINSYAAIEKIRKGDALHVTILDHTDYPVEVPPLLLLTFVENAFKHVSNLDKGNYIIIEVKAQINSFEFTIKNSIDHYQRTYEVSQNSGIGLKNIKRRLNLLYADRHQLEIKTNERSFEVHLKITFDEKN